MTSTLKLNSENYRSSKAEQDYVSNSQYKSFIGTAGKMGCEAAALAEIHGEYKRPITPSMLIGDYVDSYFSGELDVFKSLHPQIFVTRGENRGQLKSEYRQAEAMIERATKDELFMKYMAGDTQKIFTGEIEGVPVKCKVDSIDGYRITDLKTVKSISETFYAKDLGEHLNFIEWWGYDTQAAFYREVVRQNTGELLPFFICAISKDKSDNIPHPRIAVIEIPPMVMDEKLEEIKANITKIQDLKEGLYEPIRCGVCDYCADTEILQSPVSMDELLMDI